MTYQTISLKSKDTYMAPIPSRNNNKQLDKLYTSLHYLSELIDESTLFYNILRAENPGSEWLCKPLMEFYINLDNYYKNRLVCIRIFYDNSKSVPAAMKSRLSDEFFLPDEITYGNPQGIYPSYQMPGNWNMITRHLDNVYKISTPETFSTMLKFPSSKRDIVEKINRFVGKIAKLDEKSDKEKDSFTYFNRIKITKYWSEIESSIEYV